MPSRSIYQQSGFNPVSPLPFAQAKEQRVQGKKDRLALEKAREKQEKERDKEIKEQQKKLEQIAQGWGMTPGEASSKSRGELSGYIEAQAIKVANRKAQQDKLEHDRKLMKEIQTDRQRVALEKRLDEENKLRRQLGSTQNPGAMSAAPPKNVLHEVREKFPNIQLTQEFIQKIAAEQYESDMEIRAREQAFGTGKPWNINRSDPDVTVFETVDSKGVPKAYPVYPGGSDSNAPVSRTMFGQEVQQIGSALYTKNPDTGGSQKIGAGDPTQTANVITEEERDRMKENLTQITNEINTLRQQMEGNVLDPAVAHKMRALLSERDYITDRLERARLPRQSPQDQGQGPQGGLPPMPTPSPDPGTPPSRPADMAPSWQTQAESSPDKPYWMEPGLEGGGYFPQIDREAANNASADEFTAWVQQMLEDGYFGEDLQEAYARAGSFAESYGFDLSLSE